MKKVLKSLLTVLLFVLTFNVTFNTDCKAGTKSNVSVSSEKFDLVVVRTVEGDKTYINIYTDNGIFVTKFEEL